MKKDLESKKTGALAKQSQQRGLEEDTPKEDLIIPRAKLLQALSPEVQDDKMQQGLIINSLTKEVLPFIFIACFKFSNWIRFNPRKKDDPNFDPGFEPGAIIWRSIDPEDERVIEEAKFGPEGELPLATKFLNFFSYFPGVDMPIIVSFSKTSYSAGKKLLSLARFAPGDIFKRQYKLTAKQKENDIGKFYILDVAPAGEASEEDYKVAEGWYNEFKTRSLQVHDQDEDTPSAE